MKINDFIPNKGIYSKLDSVHKEEKKDVNDINNVNFGETLKKQLDGVNEKQLESQKSAEDFIKGGDIEIHDVMIKNEEAKLSLQLAVQVRNKLMEAYQEINRMQV